MSLSKLAVEFQTNAIERLDSRTLNSLSLVSKHWRNVTERYLYQDIKINQTLKLTYLLSTLFARKDLIKYVRKFSCKKNDPTPKVLLISVLPNRIHEIRTTITQATKSFPQHDSPSWHERVLILTAGDGSLALILCLATNLEQLDLNFEGDYMANYSMTSLVLKLDWELACAKQDAPLPLQSLKSFNVVFGACYPNNIDQISLIPKSAGIRQISIARLETIPRSYVYPILGTMLHTFQFYNAEVSIFQFSQFLQRHYFWNLEQLVVSQLSWSHPAENNTGYFTKTIARHLPELTHLELSDIDSKEM